MEPKVSYDQAKLEIDGWLDYKKVSDKKRDTYKDAIDTLIDVMTNGVISIDENNKIIHTLIFPVKDSSGNDALTTLEYKPRISVGELQTRMKIVKAGDSDGRIMAYVSALTGQSAGMLAKLDTEDNTICQSIAVFFL